MHILGCDSKIKGAVKGSLFKQAIQLEQDFLAYATERHIGALSVGHSASRHVADRAVIAELVVLEVEFVLAAGGKEHRGSSHEHHHLDRFHCNMDLMVIN